MAEWHSLRLLCRSRGDAYSVLRKFQLQIEIFLEAQGNNDNIDNKDNYDVTRVKEKEVIVTDNNKEKKEETP